MSQIKVFIGRPERSDPRQWNSDQDWREADRLACAAFDEWFYHHPDVAILGTTIQRSGDDQATFIYVLHA